MSKPIKDLMTKELKSRYAEIDHALVVNPIPLDANQCNELRGDLYSKNIKMEVVKNSILRRALAGTDVEPVCDITKDGPSALVVGGESVVDLAREIVDWTKKMTNLEIRGAFTEGKAYDAAGAQELAKMPTRTEMLGQLVQLANSPGSKVAGAVTAPGSRIAGCIEARVKQLEEAGDAA